MMEAQVRSEIGQLPVVVWLVVLVVATCCLLFGLHIE